ncbi:bifunctional transcriptional activator/DNA repair enzyme AdaA [Chengkuizengella marina]|uniref:Methylphosphotriester-DNA--protein-cysteine methyltransferase family protein n=1 Tax=Chengkuizengella marina TaxID=2507566 RepID=A0A6N9Q6A1_9BACL|nr:bifunctional transcriptional activator/DNA repair enzyme AdaA [Chengkuizengella marina]NBI30415.1 methylphosphotriester-DNA--protein-cysteine methyltransferase family protein [Chengkuizengella marina]
MMETSYWDAIINNDKSFDGVFFYAVKSTGIFCRPSCKSKIPIQKNVHIYKTAVEAERNGFRSCKRCCPTDRSWVDSSEEISNKAIFIIKQNFQDEVQLNQIAAAIAIDPYHLLRTFKKHTGKTPLEYLQEVRLTKAREALLDTNQTITEIALNHGFNSTAYFSTVFKKSTGYSPSKFRKKIFSSVN